MHTLDVLFPLQHFAKSIIHFLLMTRGYLTVLIWRPCERKCGTNTTREEDVLTVTRYQQPSNIIGRLDLAQVLFLYVRMFVS